MSASTESVFRTVSPAGRLAGRPVGLAARLGGLAGARVALVWDHVFRGDEMFDMFAADPRAAGVAEIVPHTLFGNIHGNTGEETSAVELLPERLREHEVDAVIVGVGA